ncbi:hypothetical protein NTH40_005068 [Vibrio harveyi]|nr:hypothetical protein [Vibrio harveyi]
MVVKLNIPNLVENEEEFIEMVVSQRTREPNKTYFNQYKDTWKGRVKEYEREKGNPENIGNSTEVEHKKKYINLYDSKDVSKCQTPIINSLRNREIQICPACGEDGTPNTLDHYLPKDLFPEYSILSKNLFPMCDICQGKKSTKVLNGEGERIFLHPYYDDFLIDKSVKLDIGKPFNAPEYFVLSPSDELGVDETSLISQHMEELELNARFSKYFKDQYFRLLKLVKSMRERELCVMTQIDSFVLMANMKSVNSWEHIFYSGVRNNEELMEYLVNGDMLEFR